MRTVFQQVSLIASIVLGLFLQQCQQPNSEQVETKTAEPTSTITDVTTPSVEVTTDTTELEKVEPVEELDGKPIAAVESLRADIVKHAATYLDKGINYSDSVEGATFDCSGFTSHILKNFDIDFTGSSATMATQGKKIKLADAKTGDLIFFIRKNDETNRVFHVGIVEKTEKGENGELITTILHSKTSKGPSRDQIPEPYYWNTDNLKIFAKDILSES